MIAERTGQSEVEAKQKTTATGFWRWMARFDEEYDRPKPDHFYYAMLTSAIECLPYRVWGKQPPDELRKISNFMLEFGRADHIKEKVSQVTEERMKQDAEFSASTWKGFLGFDESGKLTNPPPTISSLPPGVQHLGPVGEQGKVSQQTSSGTSQASPSVAGPRPKQSRKPKLYTPEK